VFHARTGVRLNLVVASLLTHDLAYVQAIHPSLQAGDVLVADRGLCSDAPLARLGQAGVHAGRRVSAHQMGDVTPGRPLGTPGVRRTPAVKGIPRSRWLQTLGISAHLVTWLNPNTWPSWLTRETLAALPETLALREVRYRIAMPGFRTRQMTLVTTRLDAESYRVADLAERSRQRWQVETALAHLKTSRQMAVRHGKTVPGVLTDLTVFAIVYHLVRLVRWQSAILQQIGVERLSVRDALRWLGAPSTGSL
jgi:hypothetical protein